MNETQSDADARLAKTGDEPSEKKVRAPRRRREKSLAQHQDKLVTILREAARLFAERGYATTSLDDIADAVQVHKATLYHYIESKEEILYQCLVRSLADFESVLHRMEDKTQSPLKRLQDFFVVLIEAQNNEFGRCMSVVGRQPLSKETRERINQFQRRLDFAVRKLILEGVEDGSIRECSPRLATAMLFGAFNWVPRWFRPDKGLTTNEIARTYLDIFINGIATNRQKL